MRAYAHYARWRRRRKHISRLRLSRRSADVGYCLTMIDAGYAAIFLSRLSFKPGFDALDAF